MARLSIRARLIVVLVVLVGFGLAVQAYGYASNSRDISAVRDQSAALLGLFRQSNELQAAIRAEHDAVDAYLLAPDANDLAAYRAAESRESEVAGTIVATSGSLPALDTDLVAIRDAMGAWRTQFAEKAIGLAQAGTPAAAFASTIEQSGSALFAQVQTLEDRYSGDLGIAYSATVDTLKRDARSQTGIFAASVLGLGIGVAAAIWLVTRWMIRPLGDLLRTAKRVHDGEDVGFASQSDDEIGRLGGELERMRSEMHRQSVEAGVVNRFTELSSFVESDGDVARAALDALGELTHPDDATIHISNRSRDRALPEGSVGAVEAAVIPLGQLSQCPGVRRSSRYVTPDLGASLAVRCPLYPVTHGTLACIPLIALGDVIGAVHLHWDDADAIPLEVQSSVSRVTDHASLAIANRRLVVALQGQASTDGRTGLPNSRAFDEALERDLTARGAHEPLAVLMLDVDHFKAFNDRNGHPAGDQALRRFAGILASSVRDGDMAARYGGEEFSVILPGASVEDAAAVAERIRARTEQAVIELSPGHRDQITVSIGIAVWPGDATTRVALLEAADAALYRAKAAGRNRWVAAGEAVRPHGEATEGAEAEPGPVVALAGADEGLGAAPLTKGADAPEPLRLQRAG